MHIELKHLRTLSVLSEAGSLTAAAARLHLTQSALSHQIKALEAQLDAPLFLRKTRPLRLTRQGERLLRLAHRVLPEVEAARRDLQRMASDETGRLFIAIECHSCFTWLMPTLDRYRRLWPEVELDLAARLAFEPLPALADGELDLVITSDPVSTRGIHYEPLFRYQALLAMSPGHPLSEKAWVEPKDLATEILITYPVARQRLDVFTRFLEPAGVEPRGVRHTELTMMMVQLVASGRGVSALPDWALSEYLENDSVIARPLGREGLHGTLFAAVRENERRLAWMESFLDTTRQVAFAKLKGIRQV
ncbi:MAG TPA: LysR family transcriptional regulator [Chromatiaceae bacterium]|nr:LysR family transcriptional regulator [Chromatiaceae bacterium]